MLWGCDLKIIKDFNFNRVLVIYGLDEYLRGRLKNSILLKRYTKENIENLSKTPMEFKKNLCDSYREK